MALPRILFTLLCALPIGPLSAHEYWISPEKYQVQNEENVRAAFRNGEEFVGSAFSYFPDRTPRFDMIVNGQTIAIPARAGDTPALKMRAPGKDTLLVVVAETAPSLVTYNEFEKFLAFTEHKDFANAKADHIANGWSQEKVKESYTRHIKSLIAIGSGAGSDEFAGLETEFVALTNPYDPDFDGQMQVALSYEAKPRADAQIEVFDRAPDETVSITKYRTDAAGEATIPVVAGHEYLFDAVVLRPFGAGDDADAAVWETLWAALTFKVPQ